MRSSKGEGYREDMGDLKRVVRFGAVTEGHREGTGPRQLKAMLVKAQLGAQLLSESLKLSWHQSEEQCHLPELHLR